MTDLEQAVKEDDFRYIFFFTRFFAKFVSWW